MCTLVVCRKVTLMRNVHSRLCHVGVLESLSSRSGGLLLKSGWSRTGRQQGLAASCALAVYSHTGTPRPGRHLPAIHRQYLTSSHHCLPAGQLVSY